MEAYRFQLATENCSIVAMFHVQYCHVSLALVEVDREDIVVKSSKALSESVVLLVVLGME